MARPVVGISLLAALLAALAAASAFGVTGSDTITTVAGVGTTGFSGDGGQATSAQLNYPYGAAVDAQGDVYVADYGNHRIREVQDGIISTVAGTGVNGFSGDGGRATSAQLNYPVGVAIDAKGNLYIADLSNERVRKVSDGIITTVAGTGVNGFSGDGGPATSAELWNPESVAVDAQGNLYIADSANNRIRKVTGGTITTVAGTGTAGFSGDGGPATSAQLSDPEGVAVDAQGNLYIADSLNNRVREVSGGTITTVAGTGTAGFSGDGGQPTSAQLYRPQGVAVDTQGNVYIADTFNDRVRKLGGGTITSIAGTGTPGFSGDGGQASSAQLYFPVGVAVDGHGSVYVADEDNLRIRRIENKLPTASFTASPASGQAPLTVGFDGSASTDPDGQITSHAWAFGDGATAAGATASHQYTAAGTFTARLTVTDDSGATVSTTRTITISAPTPPPTLKASQLIVGRAKAGTPFTVSMTVEDTRTVRVVRGVVSCTARLAGRRLAVSHRSSSAGGRVSCTWQLPKTAHGKQFKGSIADTYEGVTVSRSFSTRVLQEKK